MNIRIQPAAKNDLKAILQLQKECYQTEAEIYNDFTISPLTQDLESLENDFDSQTILKAESDRKIVASVRGFRQNETCCIGRLIVHPDVQNLGIGQKMIKAIETAFPQCKRFELFTGFRSEKNLYLYQKLGYREFRREKANTNLTLIFMEKWVR